MGSSGGHRKFPGGSDNFRDTQTHKQTLHHNIYIIIIIGIIAKSMMVIRTRARKILFGFKKDGQNILIEFLFTLIFVIMHYLT